jgi:hypothetical protein
MFRIPNLLQVAVLISSLAGTSAAQNATLIRPLAIFSDQQEAPSRPAGPEMPSAFSRLALSGGFSPLGITFGVSTSLAPSLDLRLTGSLFSHSFRFSSSGFDAIARLRFASGRASLDYYPFHKAFRISPGLLFYNQNRITANDTIEPGSSFTLNGDTFYSAHASERTGASPVNGTALLNLHATRPAFTITAGWGRVVSRTGHWSFPTEVGVALVGAPKVDVNLLGWACRDRAETQCANIANPNDPLAVQVQSDLRTETGKWAQDLNPLKTYPIISSGISYSFGSGRR